MESRRVDRDKSSIDRSYGVNIVEFGSMIFELILNNRWMQIFRRAKFNGQKFLELFALITCANIQSVFSQDLW